MASSRINTIPEAGRKYDIDFVNWTESYQGEAQFTFGSSSKKVTGIMKAANKFIKLLLTRRGSDLFNPNLGTLFDDLQYMGGDSEAEIGTFASEQINNAFSQLKSIQDNNDFPEDENISKVTLTSLNRPSQDKVTFNISLVSEAGQGVTITIPIIGG